MENNNNKIELKKEIVLPEIVLEKMEQAFNTIKDNSEDKKTQNNA